MSDVSNFVDIEDIGHGHRQGVQMTCEDRNYECCAAYPPPADPTPEEYEAWYDAHVRAWEAGHRSSTR